MMARIQRTLLAPHDLDDGTAAIEAVDLTKRYGDTTAVDGLSLRIERGEVFGLLGPNGAGKTTTILMLLGLTEPTRGHALVTGLDPTRDPLLVKSRVGYLPDEVGFYALDDLPGPVAFAAHRRVLARLRDELAAGGAPAGAKVRP